MARRDADDDEAPWLAEAGGARGRERTNVSKRSFFWTLLVLLTMAAVIAVGLILLLSKKDGGSAQGYMNAEQAPLITAEPGPYKIPPVDPKGMAVEGQDQTIYAAGEGIDQGSIIDQSATPEAPLPRPGSEPVVAAAPTTPPPGPPRDIMPGGAAPAGVVPVPTAKPVVPSTVKAVMPPVSAPVAARPVVPPVAAPPAAKPAAPAAKPDPAATKPDAAPAKKPGIVQLGAFSTPEKANDAWARLVPKHGLAGKRVIAVDVNGQTLYRLRASGDSAQICQKLKAAGDACTVVE